MTASVASSSLAGRAATVGPTADELIEGRAGLRRSVRRPSVPDLEELGKSRIQMNELSIAHQGWLTKLSRGGLPNWNRRWFILIGGSLYYSRSDTPSAAQLHVFCELCVPAAVNAHCVTCPVVHHLLAPCLALNY